MLRILKKSIVAMLLLFPVNAFSAVYEYHPSSPIRLANGLNPSNPLEVVPKCLSGDNVRRIENTSVLTTFDAKLLKTRKELYETLNVSATISGRYAFASGSGGIDFASQYDFSSDAVIWGVRAYTDYGRLEFLPNGTGPDALTPQAAALIKSKDFSGFAKQCGSEVVLQERRAAMVVAIFSLTAVSEEKKRAWSNISVPALQRAFGTQAFPKATNDSRERRLR
ncbi:hypothetical protein AMK06_CH02286 [Rhizobium sp. N541]|uniref:hypothetical protein n=1 Tax=unclassified Rhizobium TaxID=2613769 RepID=UPI0007F15F3A|nr:MULTISPECIES: hypothetical protein [unclassified Rhizobium]ANM17180.1 hypothetical protein AMK06_CH02286 [Rhizobium sp. N541]ANM23565.1 hypothetical protein AMK07_CH02283 [Rhizobium sp. N941]